MEAHVSLDDTFVAKSTQIRHIRIRFRESLPVHNLQMQFLNIAARQHGIIHYEQLVRLGYSSSSITKMVQRGILRRLHPRIYLVGGAPQTKESRWFAAVHTVGGVAALSHLSAAELWGISRWPNRSIDVIANRHHRQLAGVIVHRRTKLVQSDLRHLSNIPVTTISLTALELSQTFSKYMVANLIHRAAYKGLFNENEFQDLLEVMHGHRNLKTFRGGLDLYLSGSAGTRSWAEDRFLDLVIVNGLPIPFVNRRFDFLGQKFELDFFWPQFNLNIEVDGGGHLRPTTEQEDMDRDEVIKATGVLVLRISERTFEAGISAIKAHLVSRR